MKRFGVILVLSALLWSCTEQSPVQPKIVIITPTNVDTPITLAAEDLKADINKVMPASISLVSVEQTLPAADYYFLLGKINQIADSGLLSDKLSQQIQQQDTGARGSQLLKSQVNGQPLVILTGQDIQGSQYAVYDYSKTVLGVDPFTYWTGKQPRSLVSKDLLAFEDTITPPPVIPLLVYFENDVDELLNLKAPMLEYDWSSFTNMIDSLVRLKYNGIEMFDMLGRIEFYTRPAYLQQHPDYQLNVPHLEKMMQYVHDKGMYIQVDMMQGRQLHTLDQAASTCWTEHKQQWIDGWRYYLTQTPVKNIDIFALRPRNQLLDWKYKSTCGEDKVEVFNEVYVEFNKIINEFKPDAPRVCICYSDGMQMFNNGFEPPKDFIIAWSDDGWGTFKYQPKSTKGYKFGTYMHAGYWKNHTVMDPYPELVESVMNQMYTDYDATHYMEVNGQTFRPFLLNIEAYAESARIGTAFNAQQFYQDWTTRYFGQAASADVINAFKHLHKAHDGHIGYVEILWHIKTLQAYLADVPARQPGKDEFIVPRKMIDKYLPLTQPKINHVKQAIEYAQAAGAKNSGDGVFFHDHITLPLHLFLDLLEYNQTLIDLVEIKDQLAVNSEDSSALESLANLLKEGQAQLQKIYARREQGDQNPKWATWYSPKKRRPNNGFPTAQDFEQVKQKLSSPD